MQKESFGKAKVVLLPSKGAFLQLRRLHTLVTIRRKPLCISTIPLLAQNSRISGKTFRRALNSQFWALENANIVLPTQISKHIKMVHPNLKWFNYEPISSGGLWPPQHQVEYKSSLLIIVFASLIAEGESRVTAVRPKGAEAHSPGQHPGWKYHKYQCTLQGQKR